MMLVQLKGPPTGSSRQSCLAVGSPMGQRRRDICAGGPPRKIFRPLWMILGSVCRQTATVQRKDSVIKQLTVTAKDVAEARNRIAGCVERTPLIESEILGNAVG